MKILLRDSPSQLILVNLSDKEKRRVKKLVGEGKYAQALIAAIRSPETPTLILTKTGAHWDLT